MELAHGLLLNEEALKTIPQNKKDIFIYEWLRFLHKVLKASQKSDIKEKQKQLVEQLNAQILAGPGPPTRSLIGHCLSTLYQVGDSYTIYEIVGKCNEIVKNKDDSPSYLSIRLAAIVAIGILYENNGRMLGGLFPETVQVLVKGLKNAESQTRSETMNALRCVLVGLGTSATMCHRDIYKSAKAFLLDRSMFVRTSAAQCLEELIKESSFVFMNEFEPLIQQAVRALDGSTYEVRCAVAKMIGCLVAGIPRLKSSVTKGKKPTIDDAMALLANGFLQAGSTGGARDLLKGNSSGTSIRNIRIGITEAYVELVRELGTEWLEKNLVMFLNKVLDIVAQPKASPTHVEAVYSRRCVSFILRSTVGVILGESQQQAAVRELCRIIAKHTAIADTAMVEGNNPSNSAISLEVTMSQHVLVCATQEIGSLMRSLGTSATPLVAEKQNSIIEPVIGVLLYPSQSARLSAAWCLRCIAVALPSQLTPLIDRCAEKIQSLKSSSEALLGYSAALSALLGAVKECPMGIPHSKGKKVFSIAEGLLRSVGQNSKLAICRTQGGWLLIGALMTMGPSLASHLLPKLLQMWKTSFPRSMRELEQEKQRGDAFTWQLTLEARAGALCAMRSFVAHCPELLSEETTRKIMVPLESAMAMMGMLPDVITTHGAHLKASAAMVRLRLYDILALLPPGTYEGSFNALLRELVAEFTLTDNPAHTTTSLLNSLCHHDDNVLLESWMKETDQSLIEDQLQDSSGSGSLEHDPTSVYLQSPQENVAPGPLPLGVSVIDAAIALFGLAFPHVAMKHRLQMLKHFDDCAKQASKNAQRQRAIQTNVFTALICALKGLGESKRHLGGAEVRSAATELIMAALTSTDTSLRCAAGEAIGRMAQVGNDPTFVAKTAQLCFEKLKTARDVISRTGHSLALGCLHRYVGGMGSGQHLRMSVGILLALSQDSNSPEVQVWALHALSLVVDVFGPTFRSYVDPALHVVLTLFLQVAPHHVQVHRCLGRCLSALITTLGPELQGNASAISTARSSCLTSCAVMSHHIDAQVRSESVSCLQQLHMFAPRHVELISLIPRLCRYLSSWHLILRQSAVSCLRQLAQKEAAEVCSIAGKNAQPSSYVKRGVEIGETGLEGAIFSLLDREVDRKLISDARDTLSHILQAVALEQLGFWIPLCKSVLAASTDTAAIKGVDPEQQETGEETNDDDTFRIATNKKTEKKNLIPPRWPTRVFAIELIRRIISMCRQSGTNPAHFDLAAARNIVRSGNKDEFLVLHLSDLVKMAFMASTDNSAPLRMAGLEALQDVIKYFKDVPEPEFHGSVILEQYQANVGAALRPAFSAVDAPHEVTVRACEVCSAWIGSGVVSDLSDLKRVHALLVSSLGKVTEANTQDSRKVKHVYSESAATMEKLAILKAWAEVYISSVENGEDKKTKGSLEGSLLSLVEPHLKVLADFWLKALKDQAILKLPPEVASHLRSRSGAFFAAESVSSVRPHYDYAWPKIVHALSLWLSLVGFNEENIKEEKEMDLKEKQRENHLHLVMGVCVEALCSPRTSESIGVTVSCLSSLDALLSSQWARTKLGNDQVLGIEILNVLHRLLLTRDSYSSQKIVLSVVKKVLQAAREHLHGEGEFSEVQHNGEGGETGEFVTGKSTVFAVLEVCMCVLVRHIPSINPTFRSVNQEKTLTNKKLSPEGAELVVIAINLLSEVFCLCSSRGSLTILPTVLFLMVGILREGMSRSSDLKTSSVVITTTALQSLRSVLTSPLVKDDTYRKQWIQLLQSVLASLLEFTKEEVSTFDCTSLLTCISLFLLQAPIDVCANPKLLVQILDYFEKCLTSDDSKTQVKCLAFLSPVFRHPERLLSFSFIHRMAPLIVQRLTEMKRDCSTDDVTVATECFNLLELLVTLAENEHRGDMIEMVVPILLSRLSEHPEKVDLNGNASSTEIILHNDALQRLMQIGPKYPVGFKAAIASNPAHKAILEKALRQNQAQMERTAQQRAAHLSAQQKTNAQPSIKLKMDFSNFGKK